MSATKKQKKSLKNVADEKSREFENDVLFQRIFDKWYAFSIVEDECLMTEIAPEQIKEFSKK